MHRPTSRNFHPAIGSVSVSHSELTKSREVGRHPTTLWELAWKRITSRLRAHCLVWPSGPDDDFALSTDGMRCPRSCATDSEDVCGVALHLCRSTQNLGIAASAATENEPWVDWI